MRLSDQPGPRSGACKKVTEPCDIRQQGGEFLYVPEIADRNAEFLRTGAQGRMRQ